MAKTFAKAANALKSATKGTTNKSTSSKPKTTTTYKSTSSNTIKSTPSTSTTKSTAAQKTSAQKAAQQKSNAAALAKQQQAAKAAEAKRQAEIAAQKKAQADALAKQQKTAAAAAAQRQAEAAQRKATEEAEKQAAAEAIQKQRAATQAKDNSDYFSALSAAQQGYASGGLGANSVALLGPMFPFSWYGFFTGDGDSPMGGGSTEKPTGAESAKRNPALFSTIGQSIGNLIGNAFSGLGGDSDDSNGSSSAYNTTSGGSSYRGGYSSGGYGGYGSGGSGGSSGDLTDEEREAAKNQNALAKMNIQDLQNQLNRQLDIYNQSDAQNKRLADAERMQASRKAESDRFDAQRNLQAASLSLLGDMGQAMNGSATGNLMRMLETRNDLEDNAQLSQLLSNWEQTNNQYNDTLNQNRIARMEAMANAEKAINDATRNWMAALNNIDPSLFPKDGPVNGDKSLAASTAWKRKSEGATPTSSLIAPFVRSDNRGKGGTPQGTANPAQSMNVGYTRNRQLGGDYFSRLINQFNRR